MPRRRTCQEGSGSLLGNFVNFFGVDRLVAFVVGQFDFFETGETHDRRHPCLRPFLNLGLANEVDLGEAALVLLPVEPVG